MGSLEGRRGGRRQRDQTPCTFLRQKEGKELRERQEGKGDKREDEQERKCNEKDEVEEEEGDENKDKSKTVQREKEWCEKKE